MPVTRTRNSTVLPANARQVDVARKAIRDVLPVQQRRYAGALKVQGHESLIYNLLESGQPCSCSAKNKALATRMNEQGKLPKGEINKLLSGSKTFRIAPYGTNKQFTPGYRAENPDILDPVREDLADDNQTSNNDVTQPFENVGRDDQNPAVRKIVPEGEAFGANGPIQSPDLLADIEKDFDPETFSLSDVSCPICLGTSYIGGASLIGGWRKILVPHDPDVLTDGFFETLKSPLSVSGAMSAQFNIVLPKGGRFIDALNVWNKAVQVPAILMIDNVPVQSENDFIQFCDGKPHVLLVLFSTKTEFTHVEIQLSLSEEMSRIEFPRLGQNTDLTKLDPTDDVAIIASPEVPLLRRKDLIVEATFGKVFQVTNVTLFNDDQRRLLGWDLSARVVQPNELYNLLPRRKKTKQKTTLPVRPNPNPV